MPLSSRFGAGAFRHSLEATDLAPGLYYLDLIEEMKEKIEKDEGVKDENHLKFMKWVLQFPKPKR